MHKIEMQMKMEDLRRMRHNATAEGNGNLLKRKEITPTFTSSKNKISKTSNRSKRDKKDPTGFV